MAVPWPTDAENPVDNDVLGRDTPLNRAPECSPLAPIVRSGLW